MSTSRQGIPHIVIYPTIAHKPKFQLNSFLKASSYQLNSTQLNERAEKYADSCIEVALFSAGEAQVAILEAVAARKDADDAA
jgi:hypothetical protein